MTHYLLSIDLNTTRLNNQNYIQLLSSIDADRLSIHIYNYIYQKHNKINFNHGEVLHQYLGSRKKIALDIPQALDLIELCATNHYDKVLILSGEYESEFLFSKLSRMNVNFSKILPSALRITDSSIIKVDCDVNNFNTNYNCNIQDNEIAVANSEKINENCNAIKINPDKTPYIPQNVDITPTKLTPEQFKKIMQEKAESSNETSTETKLTAEQIKKIYAYIKLKQLKREIKNN